MRQRVAPSLGLRLGDAHAADVQTIGRCRLPDDLQDIPEAHAEREYSSQSGLQSQLTIPLKASGATVNAIGFTSIRGRIEWPARWVTYSKARHGPS